MRQDPVLWQDEDEIHVLRFINAAHDETSVNDEWYLRLFSTWSKLQGVLYRSQSFKHDPQPDQGLPALFLRVVAGMAAAMGKVARESPDGYEALMIGNHTSLTWLREVGDYLARRILKAEARVDRSLSNCVNPQGVARTAIDHFRKLAEEHRLHCQSTVSSQPSPSGKSVNANLKPIDVSTLKELAY